jgi:hypothetical protein
MDFAAVKCIMLHRTKLVSPLQREWRTPILFVKFDHGQGIH